MSANTASQRLTRPSGGEHQETALTAIEKAMFCQMTCVVSGRVGPSPAPPRGHRMSAISAVSRAASVPAAPMAMPTWPPPTRARR